jgi:hypothetical protein
MPGENTSESRTRRFWFLCRSEAFRHRLPFTRGSYLIDWNKRKVSQTCQTIEAFDYKLLSNSSLTFARLRKEVKLINSK